MLTALDDGHGGVGGLLQICLADTPRARTEEPLRQSKALLQANSDTTGDVIFAKDREGRMVDEDVPLADGTKRVWLSRKMPNRDERGRVVGLLGVSRDVTDQRLAWQRLRRLYDVVRAGFQAHIAKPVDAEELVAVLASLTGRVEPDATAPT